MLKTNQDRLVMQSVLGEIQHPTVKELPVRLDCDGVAHTLPNTGSITYNVKLGDSVYGLAGDHIEPGVTIKNHNAARENEALNVLSCIGNDAVVVSGDAKGAKGFVTGTHGGVEHVLIYFAREDLEKMVIGDKIQVRAYGQGLKLLDYPQVSVMNCDPRVLEKMNITEENGKLRVPVAAISPAYLMGSGYGEPTACFGDYDIMTVRGLTICASAISSCFRTATRPAAAAISPARRPSASLSTATASAWVTVPALQRC